MPQAVLSVWRRNRKYPSLLGYPLMHRALDVHRYYSCGGEGGWGSTRWWCACTLAAADVAVSGCDDVAGTSFMADG